MTRCEDFPCCGHEPGCCPDFDESGRQLNMVCVCGAKLPINNPSSLCNHCLHADDNPQDQDAMGREYAMYDRDDEDEEDYDED